MGQDHNCMSIKSFTEISLNEISSTYFCELGSHVEMSAAGNSKMSVKKKKIAVT